MRRLYLTTALAVGLFALACTDERQDGPTEPTSLAPTAKSCPSTDPIQSQICALFRPTDNLASATTLYNNIKTKKQQGRTGDAQARAVELVDFTFKLFYQGKLLDPTGNPDPTTADAVVKLSCDVYAFASPTPTTCPITSSDLSSTLDEHSTLQACGPAGCLALPPDKHSGVSVPKDALPGPAFIKITPINAAPFPPRSGPLATPKDQYLLFRQFELLGFDEFTNKVLVGICHLDPDPNEPFAPPSAAVDGRLKLARNVTVDGVETIEEFDRVAAPFLDCSDFNASDDEVPSGGGDLSLLQGRIGLAGRALGRTLVPILQSFLPEPAEAAVLLGSCCLGGTTSRLSPWGAVDPESGPTTTSTSLTSGSSLAIVGEALTLTATVTPAPSTGEEPLVEFFDGTTSLGTAFLNSDGVTTLSTSILSLVQHSLTARFPGTSTHGASTSSALVQNMVQRFNDRSSFNAVVGETALTQDFNSFAVGTLISSIINGVLNVTSPFERLEVWTDHSLFGFDDITRLNGAGRYDLTFVSLTKNALAFDVVAKDPLTDPAKAVVNAGGGSAEFSVQNTSESESNPVFLGFIASAPFTSAALIEGPERAGNTSNEEVSLDNFVVDAVSLPLPPIILLQ